MPVPKLSAPPALFTLAVCLAFGWTVLRPSVAQEPKPDPKQPPKAEAKSGGRIVTWRQGKILLIDPADPKATKVLVETTDAEEADGPTLSPDGKLLQYMTYRRPPEGEEGPPERVMVRDVAGKEKPKHVATGVGAAWGGRADEILVLDAKVEPGKNPILVATVVNPATGKAAELPVPENHIPFELPADGKSFVSLRNGSMGWKPLIVVCRVSRDGKKVEDLTDPAYLAYNASLAPDGKTVVFTGTKVPDDPKKLGEPSKMYVQAVGGKVVELAGAPAGEHTGLCWSPDGKRIAYIWRQIHKELIEDGKPDDRETETRLYMCDADGKNHRLLLSEKGKGQRTNTISGLDWK